MADSKEIEYVDISSKEVKAVCDGIAEAIDTMVHDFGFAMSVMDDIAKLMHKSPPDLEGVRIMLDKFFDINVPDPD